MLLLLLFSMHWESRSEAALQKSGAAEDVPGRVASPDTPALFAHGDWSTTGRGGVDGREGFIWVSRMWRFPKSWGTPRYHPFVGYHPLLIQAWGELSMKQTNQLLQNSRWKPPQALPPISAPLDSAGAVWPGVFCVDHEDRD